MSFTIRVAEQADAGGITDVQVGSWCAGHAHLLSESVLAADELDATHPAFRNRRRCSAGQRLAVATTPVEEHGRESSGIAADVDESREVRMPQIEDGEELA